MQNINNNGLRLSLILYTLLHFFTYFVPQPFLIQVLALSGLGIIVFSILLRSIKRMKLPLSLFFIGIVLIVFSESSLLEGFQQGILQMRNMVGLIIIIPMISWVLKEEFYIESIMNVAHRLLDSSRKFYFCTMAFTQVISFFLSFGSIAMMYQFTNEILKDEKGEAWERFKGTAILRGFSLSVLWVISIPSFAFVVEIMDARLGIAILQGMIVAICGMIVALIFSRFEEKRYGINLTAGLQTEIDDMLRQPMNGRQMKRNVVEFILLFVTLFGSIFIFHALISLELLVLIPLTVLGWIFLYYVMKGRLNKLGSEAKHYVKEDLQHQVYQVCIMLGAGMMIFGLNQTNFAPFMVERIYAIQEMVPFLNTLFFLPFIVIILGFFGLGPLTVMVLVGGILQTMHLPYPPELIVLTITSGSAISILLSPLILPLIMLSSSNGLSAFKNGFQFNWKYALVLFMLLQIWVQVAVNIY